MALLLLAISLLLPGSAEGWAVPLHRSALHPAHSRGAASRYRRKLAAWPDVPAAAPGTRIFSPLDYGGDPSGAADSTAAVNAAMAALLNASAATGEHDANGVVDCGGATLDLAGGEFLVSAPLVLPAYYGNLRISQGTLRASSAFPGDRFLIETGGGGGKDGDNIDIELTGLFLDCYQVAAGAVLATGLFGGVIGPQVYVFNFTQVSS